MASLGEGNGGTAVVVYGFVKKMRRGDDFPMWGSFFLCKKKNKSYSYLSPKKYRGTIDYSHLAFSVDRVRVALHSKTIRRRSDH